MTRDMFYHLPFVSPWRTTALVALAARAWQPFTEFALLLHDPVYWGLGVPPGDGHPVVVLPGLLARDRYLEPLRRWLRRVGYAPVDAGVDRIRGWSDELVDRIGAMVEGEFQRTGRRVTIVGHSLGGLVGRSVAIRRPHALRHVIALGAPLAMGRGHVPEDVRMTAIYTRDDRIVRYPRALAQEPGARNIEVLGSHVGLAVNPAVYRRLGDVLPDGAEPRDERAEPSHEIV